MRNFTINEKQNGELVVRQMCEAAQIAYNEIEPLAVFEKADGTISLRGELGEFDDLTAQEAEEMLASACVEFGLDGEW